MDRHFLEAQLLRRLPTGVTDDDYAFSVDDDRLSEAEFSQRLGQGINGVVVDARIARVRRDL